jgi:hypothetical protein
MTPGRLYGVLLQPIAPTGPITLGSAFNITSNSPLGEIKFISTPFSHNLRRIIMRSLTWLLKLKYGILALPNFLNPYLLLNLPWDLVLTKPF